MNNNRKGATTTSTAGDNHNNNNDVTSTGVATVSLNTYCGCLPPLLAAT